MDWKKLVVLLVSALSLITCVVAWETNTIQDINPDNENRLRDTVITHRLYTNETSDYDLQLYAKKPNGDILTLDSKSGKLGNDVGRTFVFDVEKDNIDQFGTWEFIVNESVQEKSTSRTYDILPDPIASVTVPPYIYADADFSFVEVEIQVEELDVQRDKDPLDEIVPGNISIYRLNSSGENELIYTDSLEKCLNANVLENQVPISEFEHGEFYQMVTNFNISSCLDCPNFTRERARVIGVREEVSRDILEKWGGDSASSLKESLFEDYDDGNEDVEETILYEHNKTRGSFSELDDKYIISLPKIGFDPYKLFVVGMLIILTVAWYMGHREPSY